MPNETAQERTEEATPRRRTEARRKGTVTRSQDVTSAAVMLGLLIVLPIAGVDLGARMVLSTNQSLSNIPSDALPGSIAGYVWSALAPGLVGVAPILGVALVAGVVANFAQVGFVVSGVPLAPNLNRINPFTGMRRLFSAVACVEGLKACVKSALFGWIAYTAIRDHWPALMGLSGVPPLSALSILGSLLKTVFLRVTIAWLAIAALDYLFQRRQVEKQLRMTREELRQEMKEMEQSPELKGAMERRRRKLSKGRMAAAVKGADVVVTNPAHVAVAIEYDPKKMHAPQVVAKGAEYLALRMKELAAENRVPIVPNPPLARQLYKRCEVGDFVPRELFQAVAEVLAFVYTTLKRVRRR